MESRPPSVPHPPFPRPSLFSAAPQHSRQYGPQPVSRTDARAHAPYDVLHRQQSELLRATSAYGYSSPSYNPETRSQTRSISPMRVGAMQSDAAQHSALASPVKHNGILGKESVFYRDGNLETSAQPVTHRQMPPPSPPQPYPARHPSGSSSHISQNLFPRDQGIVPAHRPGSSMSISSMLGSDADRPSRDHPTTSLFSRPSVSSSPFGASRPSVGAMSPPTAPARPVSSVDNPLLRRSQTPDKPYGKDAFSRQSSRSDSGGLSSEATKFAFGRSSFSQYPEKASNSQKSPHIASSDPSLAHSRRASGNGSIQRPNSQPRHEDSRPTAYSPRSRVLGDGLFGSAHRRTSHTDHEARQPLRYGGIYSDRAREEQMARERDREREQNSTHDTDSKPSLGPLHGRYGTHPSARESDRPHNRPSWETGRSQPPSPETRRFTASEPGSGFGFGAIQSYTKSLGSQLGASRNTPASAPPHSSFSLHSRQDQPTPPPHEQPFLGKSQTQPRPLLMTSIPSASQSSIGASGSAVADEQHRKGSDDLMQHRNLLGLAADGKRAGRASPLPQAVQGAQAQFIGPAGEPGIKGELGRVFAGIGSGVGTGASSSTGSGPSTPMISSPFKRDSMNGQAEHVDDVKNGRGAVALGGRKRSSKDEEIQGEGIEQAQDLRSVSSARGGSRRGRHVHHHHHHHHHHRYKNEDDGASSRILAGATNVLPKAVAPTESINSLANAASAHHHHHHHHHHHVPRGVPSNITSVPAPFALREARTSVNIEPLLKSVAHLPRHHLGSALYAPRIGVPTANSSAESQKFGYTSTPVPIPRFEGKENCTFTVRVPRFRIDPSHREEICARRALWGTGVYTDDSDPVAAAIHSGYIRGEWGEDVDISMLDLEVKSDYHHAPQPAADARSTGRPMIPPVPPANKDLHITLLILPRLERYESSLMFGIKSRAWEGTHDGMSYKIERIEWVDEGSTRGEERSGEARRKRLRNMMQTGRICTGPGLLRMRGAPGALLGENIDRVTSQPVS